MGISKQAVTKRMIDPDKRNWRAGKKPREETLELGRRLRMLRIAHGLSGAEAAESIGMKRRSWWHLEAGENVVTVERLLDIAKAFNVSPASLIADLTIQAEPDLHDKEIRETKALLRDWWQLTRRERTAVRRLCRILRKREAANYEVLRDL